MKAFTVFFPNSCLIFSLLQLPAQGLKVNGESQDFQVSSSLVDVQEPSFLHQDKTLLPLDIRSTSSSSSRGLLETFWVQVGDDIDGEAVYDNSGDSVAMSGNGLRVAIGAPYNDANGSNSGHVRVFDFIDDTSWVQVGDDIDGERAGDESGSIVAMSKDGSRVAIGAWYNDGNGFSSGHVRVFEFIVDAWVQVGSDIDGEAVYDNSGMSVAMSGNGSRVAIGAWYNDGTNGSNSGHVRVFDFIVDAWVQVGNDIDGEAASDFSSFVAMSNDGSRVAIGAHGNDGNGIESGHVRVFDFLVFAWVQVGNDIDGEAAGDRSGASVAMSNDGSRVAIGTVHNHDNGNYAGHVRVFDLIADAWVQVGNDIDGEAVGDQSGSSVAMSGNGSRVAIGAPGTYGGGVNISIKSGHVRIFDLIGDVWVQVGDDIDGEAVNDLSGASVAMSNDGSRVAIGASYNYGTNGIGSGHVRVFAAGSPTPSPTGSPTPSPTGSPTPSPTGSPTAADVGSGSAIYGASTNVLMSGLFAAAGGAILMF